MHPAQKAGLVVGGEEVVSSPPSSGGQQSTSDAIKHMADVDTNGVRFVAEPDNSEIWSLGDDRRFGGVDVTLRPEDFRKMQSGYMCLRCYEPQEESFPLQCPLCGYAMQERQIRDVAVEFTGTKHLGPSKPISDYVDELDEAAARKRFAKKIYEGGSVQKNKRRG